MNTKFSALSNQQKLALSSDDLFISFKLEAIDRGISPPTSLDNALRQAEAKGFQIQPEAMTFYELAAPDSGYGQAVGTGIAFRTEQEAKNALVGAYFVHDEGYDAKKRTLVGDAEKLTVRLRWIGSAFHKGYWTKLEVLNEDNEKFEKLCDELRDELSAIRQEEYNQKVLQVQRREYLELAGGDVSIARSFWAKTKGIPFPEAIAS